MVDKEPRDIEMSVEACQMEWSPPTLVLSCSVGAVLDEEVCDIEVTPL
jgi:hypothetical protein